MDKGMLACCYRIWLSIFLLCCCCGWWWFECLYLYFCVCTKDRFYCVCYCLLLRWWYSWSRIVWIKVCWYVGIERKLLSLLLFLSLQGSYCCCFECVDVIDVCGGRLWLLSLRLSIWLSIFYCVKFLSDVWIVYCCFL